MLNTYTLELDHDWLLWKRHMFILDCLPGLAPFEDTSLGRHISISDIFLCHSDFIQMDADEFPGCSEVSVAFESAGKDYLFAHITGEGIPNAPTSRQHQILHDLATQALNDREWRLDDPKIQKLIHLNDAVESGDISELIDMYLQTMKWS